MPLFRALRDHARHRRCLHGGRCPVVKASALVLDERGRLLAVCRSGHRTLVEGTPTGGESLRAAGARALREFTRVGEVGELPGLDGPVMVDIVDPFGATRRRTRITFLYLYRARSTAVRPGVGDDPFGFSPLWMPLDETEWLVAKRPGPLL
ncbi:NUDIX hydrolase [Streptomyces sp. NPDC051569]|uniref:NUDIX hydrolase n=1 Tax=Streptomyces sp. NPDC051569 TaxID=3365661 RepID=UPI003788CBE6